MLLLQYVKWDKADIVGYSMVRLDYLGSFVRYYISSSHILQGGAVVSAFTATFPHLVADNVTLLASVGMLEVNVSCPRLFVILIRI